MILPFLRGEVQYDLHLILCDGYVGQIGWFYAKIAHKEEGRCASRHCIAGQLPRYCECLLISLAVHCQISYYVKRYLLPIAIVACYALCAGRDKGRFWICIALQGVAVYIAIAHRLVCCECAQVDGNVQVSHKRRLTRANLECS